AGPEPAAAAESSRRRREARWIAHSGRGAARAATWPESSRAAASPSAALFGAHRLVHIVRDDVQDTLLVLIEAVIAGASPEAVGVDERHFDREELQRAVDVEERRERGSEIVEPGLSSWTARNLPSCTGLRLEVVAREVLVELLRVEIKTPAFAVDD